jgi:hypothetical protein
VALEAPSRPRRWLAVRNSPPISPRTAPKATIRRLRALKDFDDDTLALNLMAAGISVAWADDLGVDRDGRKNLRNMACWIGSNLRCRGETGVKVGVWAIEMLRDLPPSLWTAKS